MLEKTLLDRALSRLVAGAMTVVYWDGTSATYGQGTPYFTITIKSPKVIRAMAKSPSLAVGEGYTNGDVEIDGPLENVVRLANANAKAFSSLGKLKLPIKLHKNVKGKQARYIEHHYDLGNDFYRLWLDNQTMAYTCAYYHSPSDSLEAAQTQKMDHVLRKLQIKPGQTVAELGCGWGHLLVRAAKNYGATGIGVTLSREQVKYANELAKREGVDKLVKFELLNYQDLPARGQQYDRVMSVGMLEHVGRLGHNTFLGAINSLLKDGGVAVIHSITNQVESQNDPWIDKYIFPGGAIPSNREIISKFPGHNLRMIDYENLRMHYVYTLRDWWQRFEDHKDEVISMYDERFYRMWRFWLACSMGSFESGAIDLSQWIVTKGANNELPLTRDYLYE